MLKIKPWIEYLKRRGQNLQEVRLRVTDNLFVAQTQVDLGPVLGREDVRNGHWRLVAQFL